MKNVLLLLKKEKKIIYPKPSKKTFIISKIQDISIYRTNTINKYKKGDEWKKRTIK